MAYVGNKRVFLTKLLSNGIGVETETKTVTPTNVEQVVTPSTGKLLSKVIVEAIPADYVENAYEAGKQEVLSNLIDVSKGWLTITFKVGGIECKAESGMTWAEWCETEDSYYDKDIELKFYCDDYHVYGESVELKYADDNFVLPTDVIIPDYEYLW